MSFAYQAGRFARRHPLVLAGAAIVAAGGLSLALHDDPPAAATNPATAWKAPVDPADTPARRERRRQAREAADLGAVLDRMKR